MPPGPTTTWPGAVSFNTTKIEHGVPVPVVVLVVVLAIVALAAVALMARRLPPRRP